jgi:uncharacterized SAM-binding protein YcdF (DUF218 family)
MRSPPPYVPQQGRAVESPPGRTPSPRYEAVRRIRRLVVFPLGALLAVWIALDIYLFLTPRLDRPAHDDAVIVLAGDRTPRLDRGLTLIRAGVARTLVISDGHDPHWPAANRLCDHGLGGVRVICFRPRPYSTRGEARRFARLARENAWRSVAVTTSTFHVTRARMLFRRCVPGRVDGVGAHTTLRRELFNLVTEPGKLLIQLTLQRGC